MIIYGASGHGKVVLDIINAEGKYIVEKFVDDAPSTESFCDLPLELPEKSIEEPLLIAIGNNQIRKIVSKRFSNYAIAKHPFSWISPNTSILKGSVVMPGVVINHSTKIGEHCILNTNCSIDHDCIINDFVHISPNAALAGNVNVGECTQIGTGASIIQGIKIGKNVTIGAGSVVIKDIPNNAVVVGNPGRVIKYKNYEK